MTKVAGFGGFGVRTPYLTYTALTVVTKVLLKNVDFRYLLPIVSTRNYSSSMFFIHREFYAKEVECQ